MTDTGKCPISVWDHTGFASHACGRPIKRDGMCGIHAAAKEKALANDRAHAQKRAESEAAVAEVESALAELGIEGQPYYASVRGRYTGRVVVSIETLRELAERLPSHG